MGGNGRPKAACSRSHQPAPTPQNARPPLSASSVAAALAVMPGARYVTGVTSVPSRKSVVSPASMPSVTHGSGIGSHARPTCGIWIRWSMRASPSNPASEAAAAIEASQDAGSSPHGKRDICSTNPSWAGRSAWSARARAACGVCAGSTRTSSAACSTTSHGSAPISVTASGIRRSWASTALAGRGRSRARLRRLHSDASISNRTATAGNPARRATSR